MKSRTFTKYNNKVKTIFLERGRAVFSFFFWGGRGWGGGGGMCVWGEGGGGGVHLFFFFNLVTWNPRTLQSIYHQISVPKREENVCLKVLVGEVQIATLSRFPTTVGCFLCSIY